MSKWPVLRVASVLLFNVLVILCNSGCFIRERNVVVATAAQVSEAQLLLEFRSLVIDDGNVLVDWRETSNKTVCGWTGVVCNSAGSVAGINLSRKKLMGSQLHLPLCQLPFLTSLQLQENLFSGQLPGEIEQCTNLEHLNLGANNFTGPISESIFALQSLQYLNLSLNMFTGGLPGAFGHLQKLQVLDVVASGVNGSFPVELGNLVEMKNLSLSWNSFSPGGLPETFANLEQLTYFECAGCRLIGPLPSWLGKLSRLKYLDFSNNDLTGAIPQSLMALQGLKWLELYKNKLTGQIPVEIWNLTSLNDLDVSENALTGFIPDGVTKLEHLRVLHLQNNSLTGAIPPRIVDLTKLYDLKLYMNKLTGHVPETLGKNCTLMQFDVSSNELSGPLPSTLCYWGQLWRLILFNNSFTGNVPEAYGNCSSLIRIRISGNGFTGPISRGIWGLPKLNLLEIHDNKFEGNIFPTIANAKNLRFLKIYNNSFIGPLPVEIGHLSTLERLHAYQNNLSGPIPAEIGHLGSSVTSLYLDDNSFSGPIPMEISNLTKLVYLGLSRNKLSGSFPTEVGKLENLIYLDISSNNLSGDLSTALESVKLQHFVTFNCSFNNFSGTLTEASSFSSASASSNFIGNPDLCVVGTNNISSSQTKNTSSCNIGSSKHSKGTMSRTLAICIIGGVLAIAVTSATLATLAMWYFCQRQKFRPGLMNEGERLSPWSMTLFHRTTLTYKDVTECLEEENVIGSGGGGKVYKATLKNGQVIAIKKLWGMGKGIDLHDHGFKAEVDTLGAIRHRNIVKLLCCCSDFTSNLLVYEYMPNGSLGDLLHDPQNATLHWEMRYKIAIGAAQGLAYLHHDCVPQIVHRDIKSNNILLDETYEAHVADFGLAKSLDNVTMSAVAGSYGYIAPEYAYTLKVNEKSDVYSFGVVLMELVTGRRPVEPEFGDGDIVRWASSKLEKGDDLLEIFDSRVGAQHHPNMAKMFKVATACTQPLPRMRPTMREVVDRLLEIHPPQIYKQSSLPQNINLQGSRSTVEFVHKEEIDGYL